VVVSLSERVGRVGIVGVVLAWRGLEIDGESEVPAVNAVDVLGNTALHYCCKTGLVEACALLLGPSGRAILTVVNKAGETPCDVR
jgi:hypothetical protein